MARRVASGRVQCKRCPLSFSNGYQLNGHLSLHRHADKLRKECEEQKQREQVRMRALLGMVLMSHEARGSLEIIMLEPNQVFWGVYRMYGVPPKEINFIGQMCSRGAKLKTRQAKKKAMVTEAGNADVDLTLKL